MATYQITKSDGTFLTMLLDNTTNNTATSLTLFGEGFVDYGSSLDENFVYLLENFSNIIAPSNPLIGQLWYDLNNSTLNYFDSSLVWIPLVAASNPKFTGNIIVSDGVGDESELTNNGILILTNSVMPKIEFQNSPSGPVLSTIQLNGSELEVTSNIQFDNYAYSDHFFFKSDKTTGMQWGGAPGNFSFYESGNLNMALSNGGVLGLFGGNQSIYFSQGNLFLQPITNSGLNIVASGGLFINGSEVYSTANFSQGNYVPESGGTMSGALVVNSTFALTNTNISNLEIIHSNDGTNYNIVASNGTNMSYPFVINLNNGAVSNLTSISSPSFVVKNTIPMSLTSTTNTLDIEVGSFNYNFDNTGYVYSPTGFAVGVNGSNLNSGIYSGNIAGNLAIFVPNTNGTGIINVFDCSNTRATFNLPAYSPSYYLTNNWGIQAPANSAQGINFVSGTTIVGNIDSNSDLIMNGSVVAFSDERLKTDIETSKGLDIIKQLRGVKYKKDGNQRYGVIAQEIQKVLPEIVGENSGYLTVGYNNIIAFLIEAVKELSDKIDILESK